MVVQSFSQLINTDFDLKNITVTPCRFEAGNRVEYKNGRKNNLLHYVKYGTRRYTVGCREFTVKKGSVIFIPAGTVYSSVTEDGCGGVGICFDTEPEILMPCDVYTDWQVSSEQALERVQRLTELYTGAPAGVLAIKTELFSLICMLAKKDVRDYLPIKPALDHIAEHYCENLKVADYAALCNMSESYFRKRFVLAVGCPPIEYRNTFRFALARSLYAQGKTLQEIAERTGFYDAGFFSKAYKKQTGTSLKKSFSQPE